MKKSTKEKLIATFLVGAISLLCYVCETSLNGLFKEAENATNHLEMNNSLAQFSDTASEI